MRGFYLESLRQTTYTDCMAKTGHRFIFGIFFLAFIASFFLTLGSDDPAQVYFRMFYGGCLLLFFFIAKINYKLPLEFPKLIFIFIFAFILFQLVRLGITSFYVFSSETRSLDPFTFRCLKAPLGWLFCFAFFTVSFLFFDCKAEAKRLLWLMAWSGFFLAMNVIPAVFLYGRPWYQLTPDKAVFFYPMFYGLPFLGKYILGSFVHVNYTGDLIAAGAFGALGILWYGMKQMENKENRDKHGHLVSITTLSFTFLLITALGVFFLLSRGTILSFTISLLLFFLIVLIKYPSRMQLTVSFISVIALLGILFWSGNLTLAIKELGTLHREMQPSKEDSFATNIEGMKRSVRMFKANPVWGVGTGGYKELSEGFASPGTENLSLVRFKSMSHYFQLLAEEGLGAFIYYLFLIVYFIVMVRSFSEISSRFQFLSAAALFSVIIMIMIHASINHLMERFSISALVYMLMGASLGICRKDFNCDS